MSWFVAWLVLDEKRIVARRHGLVPCLTIPRGRADSEAGCCGAASTVLRLYSRLLGSRLYQVRTSVCRSYRDWRRKRSVLKPVGPSRDLFRDCELLCRL